MLGHALLFVGPEGVGRGLFATSLAAELMEEWDKGKGHAQKVLAGGHPDVHVYHPEGKLGLHSIDTIRELCEEIYLPPFEAPWKVFIIHHADRMLTYSANALLKTFEEPPSHTLIILIGPTPSVFLPTIISRCSTFYFQGISDKEIQRYLAEHKLSEDNDRSNILVTQARGSLKKAIHLSKEEDKLRKQILTYLSKGSCSDYKALQQEISEIIQFVELAKKEAEDEGKEDFLNTQYFSATQKEAMEKEIEGIAALRYASEAETIFSTLLSWYRDIQLLILGGDERFLFNPDFKEALQEAAQRGDYQVLEVVQKRINEAKLSFARSTSLSHCLETLFLQLGFL